MADAAANKRRRRRCIPMDDGLAALPEPLLYEVLFRVGNVKDLFKLAVTCRRWLRRLTDPAFLRGLCPAKGEGHAARLLGFLSLKKKTEHGTSVVIAPDFIPAPGSPLGTTSFLANDDGAFNGAKLLAARRGLVLMRQFGARTSERTISLLLSLCNPITGERHALPALDQWGHGRDGSNYDIMHGCAIITAADSEDGLNGKKSPPVVVVVIRAALHLLLIVPHKGDLYLHSYSAATRSWSMPVICPDSIYSLVGCRHDDVRTAVVHRGAAHWLCVDKRGDDYSLYKLSVKAGTTHVSLTKLPVYGGGKPFLCVRREGKLAVAFVYMSHVTVWTQQGGDEGGDGTAAAWHRTVAFVIPAVVPYPYQPLSSYEWYDFSRGAMLLVHRTGGVFILDLEKKVMEKVMDCPTLPLKDGKNLIKQMPMAYEVDLVDFFVLQLGGGPRKYYLRSRKST
ncbi:hypothetical protein U9M48_016582 [Paspalum notatum var. saurae]|uniref:F-box domain-containing protein n=1 Tax=Paspalum notatum var. saurae TaxID=547442 RepID=A0AAQ3T7R1_PASNO